MSVLTSKFALPDTNQGTHISYLLLLLLSVFIAASDFLLFLPFHFDLPQLLHAGAVLITLAFWALKLKITITLINRFINSTAYLVLFAIWSYQLHLNENPNLVLLTGLMLVNIWMSIQGKYQSWLTIVVSISTMVLIQIFTQISTETFTVYCLLLMLSIMTGSYSLQLGSGSSSPVTARDNREELLTEPLAFESEPNRTAKRPGDTAAPLTVQTIETEPRPAHAAWA